LYIYNLMEKPAFITSKRYGMLSGHLFGNKLDI